MAKSMASSRLLLAICALLAVSCASTRPAARPGRSNPGTVTPASVGTPATITPATSLYGVEEALRDALSGPLEYMGTGAWPGNQRIEACAFRNARVLVVNVYCTPGDKPAFRLDVYSPSRGRVRVYAESNGTVVSHMRQDYFTFMVESEPPAGAASGLPQLSLTMPFEALRSYEERRYAAYLPACYGGIEHHQRRGGCLGVLAPRADAWAGQHRAFLERASDDWYSALRALRAQAARYGKEPA